MSLTLSPCSRSEAQAFVAQHHRHHKPQVGDKFCLAVEESGRVVGVVVVGRPVARMLDDGGTLEVTRMATDGTKNACSFLYAAAWRATRALGYAKLITYTLPEEGGASLRAAGWRVVGQTNGGTWSRPSRQRIDAHPLQGKIRWEAIA